MSRKRATTDGVSGQDGAGELPPLPKGWCWTTLEEVAEIEGGITKDQKRSSSTTTREIPYLRVANVQRGYLNLEEMKTILAEEKEIEALRLKKGDILFTEGGDRDKLGRGWVWNDEIEECIHQNYIFRARPCLPYVEPKFVSYHGNHFGQDWFTKAGKQTTNLASINKGILRRFPVPLAPIEEQRRIVAKLDELFSDLDAGVAILQRLRTKLGQYRASVLKAAVEGHLTAEWRAKNTSIEPASALLGRILDERQRRWEVKQLAKFAESGEEPPKGWQGKYSSPEGHEDCDAYELPEHWVWATVEQVSQHAKYGSSAKTNADSDGVPVLRMGNIQEGRLDLCELKYLPHEHAEFPELHLEPGDLLFNRTNSAELVGKSAVYTGDPSPCSFASYLIALRMVNGCNPKYLAFYLNSMYGRRWIASVVSQQVGQANVNGSKLRSLAFPLPTEEEQHQIVAEVERRLSITEELEGQIEVNLKRSGRLRQSILKMAFEGRLVHQDSEDEPAEAVLGRVRTQMESQKPPSGLPSKRAMRPPRNPNVLPLFGHDVESAHTETGE